MGPTGAHKTISEQPVEQPTAIFCQVDAAFGRTGSTRTPVNTARHLAAGQAMGKQEFVRL